MARFHRMEQTREGQPDLQEADLAICGASMGISSVTGGAQG
jgi:hypothetical protein